MVTNKHVVSRNQDRLLLSRECKRLNAELDWIRFPAYLQIVVTAPGNQVWNATGTRYVNYQTSPTDARDAVTYVITLLAQGLAGSPSLSTKTACGFDCECDACETGVFQPELDFSSLTYGDPDDQDPEES